MLKRIALFAMIAMLFLAVQAGRANADLIANGNFATGDFTGWILGGDYANPSVWYTVNNDGLQNVPAAPTANYAQFLTAGAPVTISQTLAATAGQAYTVSFYVKDDWPTSTPNNEFRAVWNGATVMDLAGTSMSSVWTPYAFAITGGTGNGTNTLTFSFLQDSAMLDITHISAAPVPVPGALLLFGPGLLGLIGLRRRITK